MLRGSTRFLRRSALLLLFALALASTGCIPGVAWLPDSSGFVYTSGKDFKTLILYDLDKGQGRILVKDTGAPTLWPAVSPDGKRIAVAKMGLQVGQKETTLQVVIYSRAGKELKRTKNFNWWTLDRPATKEKDLTVGPQLFWAPKGDRILVHTFGYTGLYDLKTDRLTSAGPGILLTFGGTPVRPDGAGFLVMKNLKWVNWHNQPANANRDSNPRFAFVDWAGKETPLKPPVLLVDAAALKTGKHDYKLAGLLCPAMFESGWKGDVAQISYYVDRLRYLTDKGEAVIDTIVPKKSKDGLLVKQRYQFPGSKVVVRTVHTKWDDKRPEQDSPLRVEIVKAGVRQPKVIVEKMPACVLIPSPNQKLLALYTFPGGSKNEEVREQVIVINDQGEVVARVPWALAQAPNP
jgi:hypothetical protein